MSNPKRETKVSGVTAQDEANILLQILSREPDKATKVGVDLNERFSAAPRKEILSHVRSQLSRMRPAVSSAAIHRFLKSQCDGVKDQNFYAHFQEILGVALELPDDDGVQVAAALTAELLRSNKSLSVPMKRIPKAASILARVFQRLCSSDQLERKHLQCWTESAQSQLSLAQSSSLPFTSEEATKLLDELSRIDRKILPDSLLACVPSLIALAQVEGAAQFLRTSIGQQFARAMSGLTERTIKDSESVKQEVSVDTEDAKPREQLSRAMDTILQVFDVAITRNERMEDRLKSQEREAANQLTRINTELQERIRDLQIARTEHRDEVEKYSERIRHLELAEKELAESIERLRADLQLSDHNSRQNVVEQENEKRRRLGEVLGAAMESLRRDLERAMRDFPDSEVIRNAGISFDSLHRRLLREASHMDETRLPKELLDPKSLKG